ncbi:glutamine synthetase-like [Temnothorax curvispinosus]|uniref:glutamine synthetase n=1 Tax=Temnothorax curvispinosus TaxID=300111 RepID=A0A6J1R3D1_9HYME|nr:glutamine synthetase-like [Temnothorax curvispinosus]XP_024887311.1 glutamine synthetase-like [Temnothorax curvispinosus]XP_024887312.1 glutamine synthetase-like [Temnothorax curvispinosus]XP_024887313.1 glutamine synthetase-like [Temnothorax curvispinosus]
MSHSTMPKNSNAANAESAVNATQSSNAGNATKLDNKTHLLQKYLDLPQPENEIQVQYIWIDRSGEELCSKTKTLSFVPKRPSELSPWILENSSMFQAHFSDPVKEDIYLYPVAIYNDPFRPGNNNKLVLCDTYYSDDTPTKTNNRCRANQAMESVKDQEPWFGIKQKYTFLDFNGKALLCSSRKHKSMEYDCGIGANKVIGREIVEAHYRACLYAGVKLAGTKAMVKPSQWEFQVGPCTGIKAGDDLWIARFILHRIAEEFGVITNLDPKTNPMQLRLWWEEDSLARDASADTNFSTKAMRGENGIAEIEKAVDKLSKQHLRHIQAYDPRGGKNSERRLNNRYEPSKIRYFSAEVGNRDASIRIPRRVANENKGYLQDMRPSSNCDPYSVCDALVRTCVLNE